MKNFCFILSAIISFFTCAQKASVSLTSDVKSAQAGDLITLSVKSNVEGNIEFKFPDAFVQGGGTQMGTERVMDYNSGKITSFHFLTLNGSFKENGTYTIQAFVKNKNTIYKSNKITIKIEKAPVSNDDEFSKKALKQPIFGIVKKSKNQIYEGESVVLESKVYSRLDIKQLESYQDYELENAGENKELDKSQNLMLTKENIKGINFLTFTYDKTLYFPSATGKLKIKPFEMTLAYRDGGIFSERIAFTSCGSMIEVLPLPSGAPKNFIGAVGKFDLEYSLNKTNIKQGDVAILTVIVSGVGNLQNIDKPKINLPKGIVIYGDPETKEDFEYGVSGVDGKIIYTYNLQFNTSDISELNAISIAYFDPSLKKYIQVRGEKIPLKVKLNPNYDAKIDDVKASEETVSEETIPLLSAQNDDSSSFSSSVWFWPTVISPLFLGLLGGLFYVRRKEETAVVKDKKSGQKMKQQLLSELNEVSQMDDLSAAYQKLNSILKSSASIFTKEANSCYSKSECLKILGDNKIAEQQIQRLNEVLNQCEEARFSFQKDETHLKKLVQDSHVLISALHV